MDYKSMSIETHRPQPQGDSLPPETQIKPLSMEDVGAMLGEQSHA